MIPMRDGARLQTVIERPVNQTGPLPILLRRTPYGVPTTAPTSVAMCRTLKELMADGYIFVVQNLRGRFKSEGTFLLSSAVDLTDPSPKNVNETTDAYDTIDWLVKHVPNNNGKVGIYGVSYDGLTAGMTLLMPHPGAQGDQRAGVAGRPVDERRRPPLRRAARELHVRVRRLRAGRQDQEHAFRLRRYDTLRVVSELGPLSNINAKYLHGSIPAWNAIVGTRTTTLQQTRGLVHADQRLHGSEPERRRLLGSGRSVGAVADLPSGREERPGAHELHGRGALVSWLLAHAENDSIGIIPLGGHATAREFRENIEAPFFRYYLHGKGEQADVARDDVPDGIEYAGARTTAGRRRARRRPNLYLHSDGTLSFDKPPRAPAEPYREYVSDPANPVPYRQRPISPTYPAATGALWEVADQRFVDGRPDVLTYTSAPLDRDVTVTGALSATLFASTSGTDADFVVKLIDVYPGERAEECVESGLRSRSPAPTRRSLNGYELPIAMEVRRGRFQPELRDAARRSSRTSRREWTIPLREHDHVFLKGHRIMVQVQSTWFPLIDRNPQKFVPSIYEAKASDFVKATQRVYATPALASHITLPVVP